MKFETRVKSERLHRVETCNYVKSYVTFTNFFELSIRKLLVRPFGLPSLGFVKNKDLQNQEKLFKLSSNSRENSSNSNMTKIIKEMSQSVGAKEILSNCCVYQRSSKL